MAPARSLLAAGGILATVGLFTAPRSGASYTANTPSGADIGTDALVAPVSVSCRWTGASSLNVGWQGSTAWADGYQVERAATLAGAYATQVSAGAAATAATDTAASAGWYRVKATYGATWTSPGSTSVATSTCGGAIASVMSSGTVQAPSGIAAYGTDVYTSDQGGNRIVRTDAKGVTTTVAGTGSGGYTGDGGPATSATLNSPRGIAVGSDGSIYIADSGNNAIRKVAPDGTITTIAGTGSNGYTGDGGAATSARLTSPVGVSVTAAGVVYVADTDNNVVRRIVAGIITTFAGTGSGGYSGDGGSPTSARLSSPYDAVVGNGTDVYIADTSNNVIRLVSNGVISTVAGGGNGTCGYAGAATGAQLNGPRRLAWDATNKRLVVADYGNHCVRTVTGSTIATIAGTGSGGYTGDGGAAIAATLKNPAAVACTSSGDVVVADTGNNVTRRIVSP